MPNIIYELYPPEAWHNFKKSCKPNHKLDEKRRPMYEKWPQPGLLPRPILDFQILPDQVCRSKPQLLSTRTTRLTLLQIGTMEDPWYLEAVRRLDPRITWEDIVMRMELVGLRAAYNEKVFINTVINNQAHRVFRKHFKVLAWHSRKNLEKPTAAERNVLKSLTQDQIDRNTTRGTTPGLIEPLLGEQPGNRIFRPSLRAGTGRCRGPKLVQAPPTGPNALNAPNAPNAPNSSGNAIPMKPLNTTQDYIHNWQQYENQDPNFTLHSVPPSLSTHPAPLSPDLIGPVNGISGPLNWNSSSTQQVYPPYVHQATQPPFPLNQTYWPHQPIPAQSPLAYASTTHPAQPNYSSSRRPTWPNAPAGEESGGEQFGHQQHDSQTIYSTSPTTVSEDELRMALIHWNSTYDMRAIAPASDTLRPLTHSEAYTTQENIHRAADATAAAAAESNTDFTPRPVPPTNTSDFDFDLDLDFSNLENIDFSGFDFDEMMSDVDFGL